MTHLNILKYADPFQELSEDDLYKVSKVGIVRTYAPYELIFSEGDLNHDLYIVLEGTLHVVVDPTKAAGMSAGAAIHTAIYTLQQGDVFGEIEFLDHKPRAASVVCDEAGAELFILSPAALHDLFQQAPEMSYIILRNLAHDLSSKIRQTNSLVMQEVLANYFVRVLQEELTTEMPQPDTLTPIQKKIIIRDPNHFIVSGTGRIMAELPEKEDIHLFLFCEPGSINRFVAEGQPSGDAILNALFYLIRSGYLPEGCDPADFTFSFATSDRRAGQMSIHKSFGTQEATYLLQWELRGVRCIEVTTSAALFLRLHQQTGVSVEQNIEEVIAGIEMPVQHFIHENVQHKMANRRDQYRVFVVHHRTHEVARTLRTMHELGYIVDTFIGIPYGDASWSTSLMLDAAANQRYRVLQMIKHPTEPTRYAFDFMQASFVSFQEERELVALYENPANSGDYMSAMGALIWYELEKTLQRCLQNGQKLLVYEDGGYIVPGMYDIYHQPAHPLHTLIKNGIDSGMIVGGVEVTTAGDRRNRAIIEQYGQALVPVLSTAREDIKAIYEAIGVSEAVLQASATALGNLGLPTFSTRRVAVLGGNGAIGTRVIEQVTLAHNSTSNVFSADVIEHPPARKPLYKFPYAKTKIHYQKINRYTVADNCLPVILDMTFDEPYPRQHMAQLDAALDAFFTQNLPYDEIALTNSFPLSEEEQQGLITHLAKEYGYALREICPLAGGIQMVVENSGSVKCITLLAPHVVLNFTTLARLIASHVDTIVGVTGITTAFRPEDLDAFLTRPSQGIDTLVLTSGSSKDYEFKQVLTITNRLLLLTARHSVPVEEQLRWYTDFYKHRLSFLHDDHYEALAHLFAEPISTARLEAWAAQHPLLAQAISDLSLAGLAAFMGARLKRQVTIQKEIRPDIGSVYHLQVNGMHKRLVMLADGFVVNFYARYEKGVKTEYIDPIVTMQLLGLVELASREDVPPGLFAMHEQLGADDVELFWSGLNEKSRPLMFS